MTSGEPEEILDIIKICASLEVDHMLIMSEWFSNEEMVSVAFGSDRLHGRSNWHSCHTNILKPELTRSGFSR